MRKKDRHKLLLELIKNEEITKQEEFVIKLKERDIEVTQATISRDISELGLVKVSEDAGGFRYAAPQESEGDRTKNFIRHFARSVLAVKQQENQLYIQTLPGAAMALKRFTSEIEPEGIFGIIADDDSLLLLFDTAKNAKNYKESSESALK